MSPLHPSLGPGPAPKPVCLGCAAIEPDAMLVPLRRAPSLFICGSCAVDAGIDAVVEGGRQVCMALLSYEPSFSPNPSTMRDAARLSDVQGPKGAVS